MPFSRQQVEKVVVGLPNHRAQSLEEIEGMAHIEDWEQKI